MIEPKQITQNLDNIINDIKSSKIDTKTVENVVNILEVASDILKTDVHFQPVPDLDTTPLINGNISKDQIKTDIPNQFVKNITKNDAQPFVVCKPMAGFKAFIKREGQERIPYIDGEPIRNGEQLWLTTDMEISYNVVCCELFYPYGLLNGELFNWVKPFAAGKETGFVFTLSGNGHNTIVEKFISVYN